MGYPAARAQLSHLREPQGRYQGPNGSIIERIPPFQSTPSFSFSHPPRDAARVHRCCTRAMKRRVVTACGPIYEVNARHKML